jgi:hypothetical protein
MLKAFIFALALALAGCASAPAAQVTASGGAGVTGFATLSLWGTWEMDLAPAYTRLAALRHRAARALIAEKIDVATAIEIQKTADKARALLDESRRGDLKTPTDQQRAGLAEALRLIASAEQLLEK